MRIIYPRLSLRIGLAYLSRAAGERLLMTGRANWARLLHFGDSACAQPAKSRMIL